VETALRVTLSSFGPVSKIHPARLGTSVAESTLFANTLFVVVGDGETSMDFYHLPPREIHLAKTQKVNMQIQPIIRMIVANGLAALFFDTIRPFTAEGAGRTPLLEEKKLATS
jgi:hypothetical protein